MDYAWEICEVKVQGDFQATMQKEKKKKNARMNHITVEWLFATVGNRAGVSKTSGPEQSKCLY